MGSKDLHVPVMYAEVEQYLVLPVGGCLVDCTLGMGGHSQLLAKQLGKTGRIIGFDNDAEALKIAEQNLSGCVERCDLIHDNFRNIEKVLNNLGVKQVDGILVDLGISSFQLDDPQRGFSLKTDGPLDMRMNQEGPLSAYDLVNSLTEKEIVKILREYGEERFAGRIARRIVDRREESPIETTKELRKIVLSVLPSGYRRQKIHPATRTFQAFRIAVNRELDALEVVLTKGIDCLKPGGRMGVIAFHSLEDRIVKHKFRALAKEKKVELVFKKPLRPEEDEIRENPRARSARFRVVEKI
ncbi:MAG: 16S rRNA (cytosine(1402)-N(4))-methyltransferase RsmH [Candidatus Omnitrophica bacterium]|nr:16S rRNA (cytosine(1402)-N(4))-methyltransferase RsmH [Candidatus Omnitrophota bacterium]